MPGWLRTTGWAVVGVAALGLPLALLVAALDTVRREGSSVERGIVVAGLVLVAVALVVAAERGVTWLVGEGEVAWALGGVAALGVLVLVGVLLPGVGLVLVALGVLLGAVVLPAGLGVLVWWRWRHGPRPAPRPVTPTGEVRARAEARRAVVRARHDETRRAVALGLIGAGFTRGRRRPGV